MVQLYPPGVSNVYSNEGTLAPSDEYDWTCASFVQLGSTTQMANRSVQPFLHISRQKVPILYVGRSYPPELHISTAGSGPHVTHDSCGKCEPITQTAPQLVQSFLRRWPRNVLILYNGSTVSSKLPLPMKDLDTHGSLSPPESSTQKASRSLQPFLQASLMWQTDRPTDRPTDHATWSETIGRTRRNYA